MVKYSVSRISLEIWKQCSSHLVPEMYITKESNDTFDAVTMTTVLQLVLSKLEKSQFLSLPSIIHLQQSNEASLDNITTMSVPSRTSCPT